MQIPCYSVSQGMLWAVKEAKFALFSIRGRLGGLTSNTVHLVCVSACCQQCIQKDSEA